MDFNLTKKNLESWAAARMEVDTVVANCNLDIFMMVDEETGDEYLTIQFGPVIKLIPLESPVPRRYRPQHTIYTKPTKRDEEIEEANDD